MKMPLYSIKDDLIGYSVPFATDNDSTAMRYFHQACSSEGSIYALNPEHFNIYCLGEFDNKSGEIVSDQPRFICSALDFKKE